MTPNLYGWCGKIVKIDLSDLRITELQTMDYADRFLGGRGIATRIYWEEIRPDVGAFDPENRLILMSGPLGASGVQGASRFEVVGKSPMLMPEGFCYGNLGGYFGPYLKRAGYDGIVISGRAEKPVYVWVHDGKAEILDASLLWGKGVYHVRDILKETHGKNVRIVTTGVAGENLCRSANLMTDNEGSATGGFGAVMGSKNLKAVAVSGSGHPLAAHPDKLKDLNRLITRLNKRGPFPAPFPKEQVYRSGKSSCYQCGLDCKYRNAYRTASGEEVVRKCQSMFVYFPWVVRRPGESAETAVEATGICNDLSICTMEMSNIIKWLESCFASGYLGEKETGLNISTLGTREFFETLAHMIAYRKGFGDILAQGLLRAGETLGKQAKAHFDNEVSGVGSGATYSGREYLMNGLLYALEPRQPIAMLHEISWLIGLWVMNQADPESSPVTSDVFQKAATKFWKHEKAWDLTTHEGKAMAAKNIIDRTYTKDSLLLCDSVWPLMVSWDTPDRVGDPGLESRIFNAVTGIEIDETGLNQYGERIFNLQRGILLREGRRPKIDDVPTEFNFTDPVETVFMNPDVIIPGPGGKAASRKGDTLKRDEFETMRMEFYELRGWDPESGLQKTKTLERLGMSDIAEDLKRMNLIQS
ncbi:MAG: aldehyde ferredoxin oxidoreductase N-terminal domain-containing protein [Desulfobacterales bacterium]